MIKICRFLACKRDTYAFEVATHCGISVQKAVGVLRKLAHDDKLIKISRHYKSRNTYNLAKGITFYKYFLYLFSPGRPGILYKNFTFILYNITP
jgi:hypothetical protein